MKLAPMIALAGLCLVTACGPKGGNSTAASASGGGGAAPASGPDVTINLSDLPRQRAGLWQTTLDDGDGHPDTNTRCVSGAAPDMSSMPKGCTQYSIKRTFTGAYVFDMNCKTAEFSMVGHTVATGDFQTQADSDTEMTMTIAGQAPKTSKMHVSSHWVGPCAPGQKPDDAPDTTAPSGTQ
jgi:hypothetical protein